MCRPRRCLCLGLLLLPLAVAHAQLIQQGPSLSGNDASGSSNQGFSVSLSADGNTAIVGGLGDNQFVGAAWVYARVNGVWSQQGPKLVGTDVSGSAEQGHSVFISADGNTAIVGGYQDNGGVGAAWVFTRSGSTWTQQGPKLVAPESNTLQGAAVALSADGNTALVGTDSGVWIWVRNSGAWSIQGSKLVGNNDLGGSLQGFSVALSADGSTAALGGPFDNNLTGAAWVFARSGSTWTQQGPKLVPSDLSGTPEMGASLALSADGSTLIAGGPGDNSIGAAWVFQRSGNTWTQQGPKLTINGYSSASLGASVALSADGNTALVGAPDAGGAFTFLRTGGTWSQFGPGIFATDTVGPAFLGNSVALSADATTAIAGGYTDNSNIGAAWVFFVPPFFSGQVPLSNGVYYLAFPDGNPFGYYSYLPYGWMFHFDLGYLNISPTSGSDIYLYDLTSGHWWYTSRTNFPYIYDFSLNTWLYYFPASTPGRYTTNPRVFANLTTHQIISM